MVFLDIDNDYSQLLINNIDNDEVQNITIEDRMKLIAKATLDRRLNARDLKLFNYVVSCRYLNLTQEEIAELLDISRSNLNKSVEKLASFNYIETSTKANKRKSYHVKKIDVSGFIDCNPHDIVRVLNVSNVTDTKLKYIYCNQQELMKYETYIQEYKRHINFIEKHYNSANKYSKEKADKLIQTFSPSRKDKSEALERLESDIEDFKEKICDVKMLTRKLERFVKSFKSNVVSDEDIITILDNRDAQLILFLDRAEGKNFKNFKEKYLEDYIKFVCMFTDLSQNEDFFKLYYENKNIEMSTTQMIKLLGFSHREVPHKREAALNFISKKFEKFFKKIDESKLSEDAKALLDELEVLSDKISNSDTVYNSREIALILYVTGKKDDMKSALGLSYNAFVEMYNLDLFKILEEYEAIIEYKLKEEVTEN